MFDLAICLATRKRNRPLITAIRSVVRGGKPEKVKIVFLVADNDPFRGAEEAVYQLREETDAVIEYLCVEEMGIPFARNALLRRGMQLNCSSLVFIDDDEEVSEKWLNLLHGQYMRRGANIVAVHGPVFPRFSIPIPYWLPTGMYSKPLDLQTGTLTRVAATNNVILNLGDLKRSGLFFNEKMAFCGGSDTEFFQRWSSLGKSFEWCREAVVYENIPASRMRFLWLVRRYFRYGTSGAFINKQRHDFMLSLIINAKASIKVYREIAARILSPAGDRGGRLYVECFLLFCKSAGYLMGSFGVLTQEYKQS